MRKRVLLIGDPHLQVQRLEDGNEFINKVLSLVDGHDRVVILGDLFHTFAVIRSEVLDLWNRFFNECPVPVIALVGNHDFAGQSGGSHALKVFQDRVTVIQSMTELEGSWWSPFYRDHSKFEEDCKKIPAGSILFCHQSFQGSQFENGFYDPEGIPVECVTHLKVISGHIHKSQTVGPVWFPGTPFQHSFGEAGQEKRIYSIEIADGDYRVEKEHDLQMPEFVVIEAESPAALLDMLPSVNPRNQYKLVSKGSPAEIAAFWKADKAKEFRSGARRVVDGMIPDKGDVSIDVRGETGRDKIANFIRDKKWRTDSEQLLVAVSKYL